MTSLTASSTFIDQLLSHLSERSTSSAITTDSPGRVDKTAVLQAIQKSGESYDQARETLKHVSVDASGKVELEDWVEVTTAYSR